MNQIVEDAWRAVFGINPEATKDSEEAINEISSELSRRQAVDMSFEGREALCRFADFLLGEGHDQGKIGVLQCVAHQFPAFEKVDTIDLQELASCLKPVGSFPDTN